MTGPEIARPTMAGLKWTDRPPVHFPGAADGWYVRDAFCEMFGWGLNSTEATQFIENPLASDLRRLAAHLGLAYSGLESAEDWNRMITDMDHPGITTFVFAGTGGGNRIAGGHTAFVHHVHALLHHWPKIDGQPSPQVPRLSWPVVNWPRFGWPLQQGHLRLGPILASVIVDLGSEPRAPAHLCGRCQRRLWLFLARRSPAVPQPTPRSAARPCGLAVSPSRP